VSVVENEVYQWMSIILKLTYGHTYESYRDVCRGTNMML
jgi:hypothetical protein